MCLLSTVCTSYIRYPPLDCEELPTELFESFELVFDLVVESPELLFESPNELTEFVPVNDPPSPDEFDTFDEDPNNTLYHLVISQTNRPSSTTIVTNTTIRIAGFFANSDAPPNIALCIICLTRS